MHVLHIIVVIMYNVCILLGQCEYSNMTDKILTGVLVISPRYLVCSQKISACEVVFNSMLVSYIIRTKLIIHPLLTIYIMSKFP